MIYRLIYLLMNQYVFGTSQKLWLIKYCLPNSTQTSLISVPLNFLWHRIAHVLSSPHGCPSPSCIVFVDVIYSAIPNRKLQNYILFKITTITTTLSINIKLMLYFVYLQHFISLKFCHSEKISSFWLISLCSFNFSLNSWSQVLVYGFGFNSIYFLFMIDDYLYLKLTIWWTANSLILCFWLA